MKFLTSYEVGEVRGDQTLARHCYTITLQGGRQVESYPIDGLDACDDLREERGEPIEDIVEVLLNDGHEDHTIQISSNLGEEVMRQLVAFL